MKCDFFTISTMEISHYRPVVVALREMGVDARIVNPFSPRLKGWSSRVALMDCIGEAVDEPRQDADIAISTQPPLIMDGHYLPTTRTVRIMYGVGLVKPPCYEPHYAPDYYLVHGPFTRKHQFTMHGLKTAMLPDERVFEVGYPRLDEYFSLRQTRIDEHRIQILYLPTWGQQSSVERFAEALRKLPCEYLVHCKPHHATDVGRMVTLEGNFNWLLGADCSQSRALACADMVVGDLCSGAYTEAILAGKPVLGLADIDQLSHLALEWPTPLDVCINPETLEDSIKLALWNAQETTALADHLFGSTRGHDAARAAKAIIEIGERG